MSVGFDITFMGLSTRRYICRPDLLSADQGLGEQREYKLFPASVGQSRHELRTVNKLTKRSLKIYYFQEQVHVLECINFVQVFHSTIAHKNLMLHTLYLHIYQFSPQPFDNEET
jgi:hypothetical protein